MSIEEKMDMLRRKIKDGALGADDAVDPGKTLLGLGQPLRCSGVEVHVGELCDAERAVTGKAQRPGLQRTDTCSDEQRTTPKNPSFHDSSRVYSLTTPLRSTRTVRC